MHTLEVCLHEHLEEAKQIYGGKKIRTMAAKEERLLGEAGGRGRRSAGGLTRTASGPCWENPASQHRQRGIICTPTKRVNTGAPGWLRRLGVRLRLRSQSHGPWVRVPRQALCRQLGAWSLLQVLCLPLSATPLLALCLYLSKINKH